MATNLKYDELFKMDSSYRSVVGGLKNPHLVSVARTYLRNMDRFSAAASLPGNLLLNSIYQQEVICETLRKYDANRVKNECDQWGHHPEKMNTNERAVFDALFREAKVHFASHREDEKVREHHHKVTMDRVAVFAESEDGISFGVESFLASLIVHMWSNFEILAGDLWETAINFGPSSWREGLVVTDGEQPHKKNEKKLPEYKFSISDLENPEYDLGLDLRNKIGTMARLKNTVKFSSWAKAEFAYRKFVNLQADRFFDLPEHHDVKGLSALRNLLVHKAGRVDSAFERQVKKYELFSGYGPGEEIPIDGVLVRRLCDSAAALCNSLLIHVDHNIKT